MKFFLDTANVEEIRQAHDLGILDGVTTNPSLVAKEGREFHGLLEEILRIVDGIVNAEVVGVRCDAMVEEGRELAKIHPNIVVKIPLIAEGLKAVRVLTQEGIRTNVTLCFSANQGLLAAKAGAFIISPFVGRLDDIGHDGMEVIRDLRVIYDRHHYPTQILVGSIRHPLHVLEAAKIGADIATMPWSVMKSLVKHPLTDVGLERFLSDWNKLQSSQVTAR